MKKISAVLVCLIFLVSCSSVPKEIGMKGQFFHNCPNSPNCVSTMEKRKGYYIAPIKYSLSKEDAFKKMLVVINAMNKVTILKQTPSYIHAVFRTPLMNFADDVEFYFPEKVQVIHLKSASRIGFSDMGVNRKRVESIRKRFRMK
jgi:uncharacterized protein (DUF1499 family)